MALEYRGPFLLLFAVDRQLGQLLATAMSDCPLKPDEFAVTSALRLAGPIRPSDLAALLGMRPTTLSNYLRRFEADGTVSRSKDPSDGRASLLSLTPQGVQGTEACFPAFGGAIGDFQKAMVEEGIPERDLLDTLEAVSRALATAEARLASE